MNIKPFLVLPHTSILDAIAVIDTNRKGIAIIVDKEKRFQGVATDGDIRRAILAGLDLKKPVTALLNEGSQLYPLPVSGGPDMSYNECLSLMRHSKIRHLPIIDDKSIVVDMILLDDWLDNKSPGFSAVVMAGGRGQRLRPLTDKIPKPMLPVNGKPMLERVITQLRDSGIKRVCLATHYKSEYIINYFGDGIKHGVEIDYIKEIKPLGTAGALGLLETPKEPFLVINGDILTKIDFKSLFAFHMERKAALTVAVRKYVVEVTYGVVALDDGMVTGIEEKPCTNYFVNAGIYLISPSVMQYLPQNDHRFDMTDLITILLKDKQRVASFPIYEYWLDIGKVEDYKIAQTDVKNGNF